MKKKILALGVLFIGALVIPFVAFGTGETTGTNTAAATACVPAQTATGPSRVLSRDGSSIYTEPRDVVTVPGACQTATNVVTYTIPTVTVTTTVGTTTAPPPPPPPTRHPFDVTDPSTPGTINPTFPRSLNYCASNILLNTWEPLSRGDVPYDVARDDLPTQGWGDGDSRFAWWSSFPMWLTRRAQIDDHYSNGVTDHAMTTTEMFSFAACRWGIREDLLRAVAVKESDWQEKTWGDRCTSTDYNAGIGSYGIMQMKNLNCSNQGDWGGFTRSGNSVPFSVDAYGAAFRSCLEQAFWYTIPLGDSNATRERGCVGAWFGGSYDPNSSYDTDVYNYLASRAWLNYG